MRIFLVAVGRMKDGPERLLAARYLDRAAAAGRALGLTGFSVVEIPESRAASAPARRKAEAEAIGDALPGKTVLAVLDERGRALTSRDFAGTLAHWRDAGRTALALAIGGADGLDARLRERADLVLSFSPMTWPHQLVRVMAAEQLYRATTILSGHPYHRGD